MGPQLIFNDSTASVMSANVAALQTAINSASAVGSVVQIIDPLLAGGAVAYFNGGITIDLYQLRGFDGGLVQLNFSLAPDATRYVSVITSHSGIDQRELAVNFGFVKNVYIVGNGRANTSIAYYLSCPYFELSNCFTYACGTVEYLDIHAYMIKHRKFDAAQCGIGLDIPGGSNLDKGESISYDGCAYQNSDTWLQIDYADAHVQFSNGSLDFLGVSVVSGSTGSVGIDNTNIEGNVAVTWFQLTGGQQGKLHLQNCHMQYNAAVPSAMPAVFDIASTWQVINESPFNNGFDNSADVLVIGNGAGNYRQSNWKGFLVNHRTHLISDSVVNHNILADGDFSLTTLNESDALQTRFVDLWTIWVDTTTITTRTKGRALSLFCTNDVAPSGQTQCLQASLLAASGSNKYFVVYAKVDPFAQYVVSWQDSRDVVTSGTYAPKFRWQQDLVAGPRNLEATFTIDWPNLASGAISQGADVTVTGAIKGGICSVSARDPGSVGNGTALEFFGIITADNTVTPFARNPTTGAINMGSDVFIARCTDGWDLLQAMGGAARIDTESGLDGSVLLTPGTSWTTRRYPAKTVAPFQAPSWAHYCFLQFDCSQMEIGKFYVGDVRIQKWSD